MLKTFLHNDWFMKRSGSKTEYLAHVPGSVCNDLFLNRQMEDPYYRDNEMKVLELMDYDYEYQTMFDVDEKYFQMDEVILHFDGLDTVADIYLNGYHLGNVSNMHRQWEFVIGKKPKEGEAWYVPERKSFLKKWKNELKIIFHSPTKYIKECYDKDPVEGSEDAMVGFPQIRKPHYMFGWDWGPRIPDEGIWRPVSLLGIEKARLSSVYVKQNHVDGKVELELECKIKRVESFSGKNKKNDTLNLLWENECKLEDVDSSYSVQVTVYHPDGEVDYMMSLPGGDCEDVSETERKICIEDVKLWWPNGYGEQPLYTVRAELYYENNCIDVWEKRIGLRTMEISRKKDQYGESFAHCINGVEIFAMGADYIPEDNILSRVNEKRTRTLLEQCIDAHFNCIRIWGGGCYPEDYFYDICDELGLVVWQDFMFACAVYHLTDEFEENICAEIIDNVRRLRHHASLGLWCGNNEMEQFVDEEQWGAKFTLKSDYVKMYEYLFPKILKKEDPDRFYWPASPSSGGGFDYPNDPDRGDVHYWDVWHGNKPFTEYRKFHFRYLSEFGFQSFPSMKTIETFTEPGDRNVFSYVMEKHQRNASANGKIMNYMEQMYLYPTSFDTLIYASQLLQAEAIRYGVEHFRRHRGRCMGTVYWQLNDCWPVASWASIDYYGRWKALHYYAKRFFAPLMISCEEEGLLSQTMNVNAQPFDVKRSIRLNVVNETLEKHDVTIRWQLRNPKAEVLHSGEENHSIDALSAKWLEQLDFKAVRSGNAELYENYVSYQLYENERLISEGTVLFVPPKHYHFEDPQLFAWLEGEDIVITAEAYAKSVEIRNSNDDLILSDNFFDMNAGEKRVKILKGNPDTIIVRSVYDIG